MPLILAANPKTGGDPKTLNLASMQDSRCLLDCSWQRTVTNRSDDDGEWELSVAGPEGLGPSVSPGSVDLDPGESAVVTISAHTRLAPAGWNFGEVQMTPEDDDLAEQHMPIAVLPVTSTDDRLFTVTADKAAVKKKDVISYTLNVTNASLGGAINVENSLPKGARLVAFGLAALSYSAANCPDGNCDEGGVTITVPVFTSNGEPYSRVIMSVNGTLEVGAASGEASSFINQQLPDAEGPNNIIAPLWTDFDLSLTGNMHVGVISDGVNQFTVYEWDAVPLWNEPCVQYSMQIRDQNTKEGGIWVTCAALPYLGSVYGFTVGVEDAAGIAGASYFYNGEGTEPAVGADLAPVGQPGGSAQITFDAKVKSCKGRNTTLVNTAELDSEGTVETAVAVTTCDNKPAKKAKKKPHHDDDDDDDGDDED